MPDSESHPASPTTAVSVAKFTPSENSVVPSPITSVSSVETSTTKPDETERYHHPYSPSTLGALEACPRFLSRESNHERTRIGTIAHEASEKEKDDLRLSDDDAALVAECLDFYEQRKQTIIQDEGSDILELKETYLVIDDENFVDHDGKPVRGITAGYVDRAILSASRRRADIFDWKFGRWAVEDANNNLQGIAYALGLLKKYPSLESVQFWFKQPMIKGLTTAIIRREDIPTLYLRIRFVVERAKLARATNDFSGAVPRAALCTFCANLAICPKVAELVCNVGKKYNALAVPADITPSRVHAADDAAMSLMVASVVKEWAEAYRRRLSDRVLRGDAKPPPGYEIGLYSRREIVSMDKFKEVALTVLTPEEYDKTLSTTFEAVEKQVSEKAPRGQKTAALEAFQAKLIEDGAVVKGQPYAVLRVSNKKETKETPKQITNNS